MTKGILGTSQHFKALSHIVTYALSHLLICIGLLSCNDPQAPDFLKSTGPDRTAERPLAGPVRRIVLHDNVALVLRADSAPALQVAGGANLLPEIATDLDAEGTLTIRNLNRFRWVRSYSRPITVQAPGLRLAGLLHQGTGAVTCPDTLRLERLSVQQYGTSQCTVLVRAGQLAADVNGSGSLRLAGRAAYAYLATMKLARLDAQSLHCRAADAECRGPLPLSCQVSDTVAAFVRNRGDIVIYGSPKYFIAKTGSGSVLFR